MPSAVTRLPVVPGGPEEGAGGAERRTPRRRRTLGLPLVVTLLVLVLAEGAVRVGRSSLSVAPAWPAPELQKKYDQIVARAASGQATDVVLVGDSMMDAAGDPDGLAAAGSRLNIYNASVAGETLPTIAQWTTKVVVPRLHPKVVVVGFSSNELNPSVLNPAAGLGAYERSRAVRAAQGDGGVLDRADAVLRNWSVLYRYRDSLRRPLAKPPPVGFDPKLSPGGQDLAFVGQRYLQSGGFRQARAVVGGVIATLAGFVIGPKNVTILQDMLTTLHRQGIEVVLMAMPVTADLVSFHPAGAADYQRALDTFASVAKASGAIFAVPGIWPISEFADPVHLNGAGTVHFSAYLAPLLHSDLGIGSGTGPGSP